TNRKNGKSPRIEALQKRPPRRSGGAAQSPCVVMLSLPSDRDPTFSLTMVGSPRFRLETRPFYRKNETTRAIRLISRRRKRVIRCPLDFYRVDNHSSPGEL